MQMSEFDDSRPPPFRAPREERWLERLLDSLKEQNREQTKLLELVRGEMSEFRQVAAKEIDCAGRSEREHVARSKGLERVFEEIKGVRADVAEEFAGVHARLDKHSAKIEALVGDHREHTGAIRVIRTREEQEADEAKQRRRDRRELIFKWAAAVLIAATISIASWVASRLME
jgi:septal ring factor EnvC (AmiA/AmiB activator)